MHHLIFLMGSSHPFISLLSAEDPCRCQTSTPAADSAAAFSVHTVAQTPVLLLPLPSWDLNCWEIQQIFSCQRVWKILRELKRLWAAGSVFSEGHPQNFHQEKTQDNKRTLLTNHHFTRMHRSDFILHSSFDCPLLSFVLSENSLSELTSSGKPKTSDILVSVFSWLLAFLLCFFFFNALNLCRVQKHWK